MRDLFRNSIFHIALAIVLIAPLAVSCGGSNPEDEAASPATSESAPEAPDDSTDPKPDLEADASDGNADAMDDIPMLDPVNEAPTEEAVSVPAASPAAPLVPGFKASTFVDAAGVHTIHVEGVVEAPHPGYKVTLNSGTAGLVPTVLYVSVSLEEQDGTWAQVVTPIAATLMVPDKEKVFTQVLVAYSDGYTEYIDFEVNP